MKAWCLELDGRRDRDECAKPIVGRGTGPAVDPVAVFFMVRLQEKEMRKAARKKCGKADISTFGPLRPSPTQAGILLRSWLENRSREGFGRMSK